MIKSMVETGKFKRFVDILAIITIPYIFVLSILWNYGMFHKLFKFSLLILTALWLIECIRKRKSILFPGINKFILAVMMIIVIASTASIYILMLKNEMYNTEWIYFVYVDAAALVISMLLYACRKEKFEIGLRLSSMFVLVTALWGNIDYMVRAVMYHPTFNDLATREWRICSIYQNPIPAGHIVLMFLWIPFSLKYNELSKKRKTIDAVVRATVYVPFILATGSRSIWMGLIFSALVWLVACREELLDNWKNISKKIKIALSVFATIVAGFGLVFAIKSVAPRFSNFSKAEAYVVRSSYFRYTLERVAGSSILRILLGHGSGSCRNMIADSPCYVDPYDICDNAYLSMLYEWGIVAIVAVIVIDIFIFKHIIKAAKDKKRNIAVSCAYAAIACIFPIFFYEAQMWLMVAVPMAIFVAGGISPQD